jgi:hypothetical protein
MPDDQHVATQPAFDGVGSGETAPSWARNAAGHGVATGQRRPRT